jgi:hypothetical protein
MKMANPYDSEFDKSVDGWAAETFATKMADVPEILYHYTDAGGLLGMLMNSSIWATDYRFLNDKTELEHTRSMVKELLDERDDDSKTNFKELYSEIMRLQDIPPPGHAFVFSLTELADDLSQWRGYAREGRGFTIGFHGPTICRLVGSKKTSFLLSRIQYDKRGEIGALSRLLQEIEELAKTLSAQPGADLAAVNDAAARAFDVTIENRAVTNKHGSFASEKEWRLTRFIFEEDLDRVKVRSNGDRLIRYLDDTLEKGGRLPIKRVGIGPGFSGPEEVLAVKQLCRVSQYDPEIYFADTPYRRV